MGCLVYGFVSVGCRWVNDMGAIIVTPAGEQSNGGLDDL
jgi:hypothetical protein